MEYTISAQPTPNPNALKFVLNVPAKSTESAVFKLSGDASSVPMAAALLALPSVTEVYFSGHFITVTQSGGADWDLLESQINDTIQKFLPTHNPDFNLTPAKEQAAQPVRGDASELSKIEEVLDRTIRPALQHDGGDLQVVSLEGKLLTISYQGACGCCPHATMGTLYAIQNILRDQYDPEMVVEMA